MIDEKEKMAAVPLQAVGAEREDAEPGESAAAPPTFRGLPIQWVEVPTTKTIVCTKNAFGDDDTEDRNSTRHLIAYNEKEFTRAEFMSNVLGEIQKISVQGEVLDG